MLVECVSIEWVTLLPNLPHHMHNIIRQLDSNYKLRVRNMFIRPQHSSQRTQQAIKAGTTTCFLELDNNNEHERLVDLINRYPFHGHGWNAQISRLEFMQCDEITVLSPCKCNECDEFSKATTTRMNNRHQKASSLRSTYLAYNQTAAVQKAPQIAPSMLSPYAPADCNNPGTQKNAQFTMPGSVRCSTCNLMHAITTAIDKKNR